MKPKKTDFIEVEAEEITPPKKSKIGALVGLIAGLAYLFSPIDLIPDVPVLGWIDDFFVVVAVVLNFIQTQSAESNVWLSQIAKTLKWLAIILGVLVILLVLLLSSVIVSLFK